MIERLQASSYISSQPQQKVNEQSTAFSELLRQRMENVGSMPTVTILKLNFPNTHSKE